MVDVLIVGGSVAGLSAALLLGRCRRSVLVCDAGRPRNRFSRHMHGFLSREGISPKEFLNISRKQVAEFPNVQFYDGNVSAIQRAGREFITEMNDGSTFRSTVVLLATGIVDELPNLPGIEELYGKSVHHCPYCDGWEHKDEPIAVCGRGEAGVELAREMLIWSKDVTYFSDGSVIPASARGMLASIGVRVIETKIVALAGTGGSLEKISLSDGKSHPCKAMFFVASQRQNCDFARALGCELEEDFVISGDDTKTCVPGLYVAGNTSTGLQLAIVAAAEGAKAAHSINTDLLEKIA